MIYAEDVCDVIGSWETNPELIFVSKDFLFSMGWVYIFGGRGVRVILEIFCDSK